MHVNEIEIEKPKNKQTQTEEPHNKQRKIVISILVSEFSLLLVIIVRYLMIKLIGRAILHDSSRRAGQELDRK